MEAPLDLDGRPVQVQDRVVAIVLRANAWSTGREGSDAGWPGGGHRRRCGGFTSYAVRPEPGMQSDAISAGAAWNKGVFNDLAALIGPQKAQAILTRFQGDLARRFADLGDRETLRRDAHATTSMSGMLGFQGLSALAKTLELDCRNGGDLTPSLSAFLQARQGVTALLDENGSPA